MYLAPPRGIKNQTRKHIQLTVLLIIRNKSAICQLRFSEKSCFRPASFFFWPSSISPNLPATLYIQGKIISGQLSILSTNRQQSLPARFFLSTAIIDRITTNSTLVDKIYGQVTDFVDTCRNALQHSLFFGIIICVLTV